MIYTGVGSRETPPEILKKMERIAARHAKQGHLLRSGGAKGADQAFERGCDQHNGRKEIFLPWKGYELNSSPLFEVPDEALEIAEETYGDRWKYLKTTDKLFMGRNVQQVLGQDLRTPSDLLICWTPDGCITPRTRSAETGGTGQAIAVAYEYDVAICNLKNGGGC